MALDFAASLPPQGLPAEHLEAIIATQSALASAEFDLQTFMDQLVEQVQTLTAAAGAVVELVEGEEMVYRAASGSIRPFVGLRLKRANSLSGLCIERGEVLRSDDTSSDPRVDRAACQRIGALSMVVVPLFQQGKAIGVVKTVGRVPGAFGASEIRTLQLMAGLLGGALAQQLEIDRRRQLEAQLRYMAQTDALTLLPNRTLFKDRLAQAIKRCERHDRLLALMYLDLDHFKEINDTLGHGVGDALLRAFAERVRATVRAADTVARLGGDEFAVIAEDLPTLDHARTLAAKISETTRNEFQLEGRRVNSAVSIGVAASSGAGIHPGELLRRADDALYRAKKRRNGEVEIDLVNGFSDTRAAAGD